MKPCRVIIPGCSSEYGAYWSDHPPTYLCLYSVVEWGGDWQCGWYSRCVQRRLVQQAVEKSYWAGNSECWLATYSHMAFWLVNCNMDIGSNPPRASLSFFELNLSQVCASWWLLSILYPGISLDLIVPHLSLSRLSFEINLGFEFDQLYCLHKSFLPMAFSAVANPS